MKAIVRESYGPPDVLHLDEVPLPTVGDGDVLVRVKAASANAGDWHLLRGTPFPLRLVAGLRKPKFRIIGNDIAGYVETVGRNVTTGLVALPIISLAQDCNSRTDPANSKPRRYKPQTSSSPSQRAVGRREPGALVARMPCPR